MKKNSFDFRRLKNRGSNYHYEAKKRSFSSAGFNTLHWAGMNAISANILLFKVSQKVNRYAMI